jgi:enoyl-CoA hydratase
LEALLTSYDLPEELSIDAEGPIRVVSLNRPDALNAVNEDLHRGLAEVWPQLAADPEASVVILRGAGRAFSAGGDMDFLQKISDDADFRYDRMREARRIVSAMMEFPLPVIAAVNGPAVGLGCSVALLCDIVLMSSRAYFADPHVSIGLVAADGGVLCWPLLTSLLRAKEYLFTGDRIDAPTALELGLANRVVDHEALMTEAHELATRLAEQPAQALRDTKRSLNLHLRAAVDRVVDFAFAAEAETFATEEFRRRILLFRKG